MIAVSRPLPFLMVHQLYGSKWWLTLNDVSFFLDIDGVEHELFVPAGYRYDRSSIPWEVFISKDSLGCLGCLAHDVLYFHNGELSPLMRPISREAERQQSLKGLVNPYRKFTREEADLIFKIVMDKDRVSRWKSRTAWAAVRVFARRRW